MTSSFEQAEWVVVATVGIVEQRGSTERAVLAVEEQFKGPELGTISLSLRDLGFGGHASLVEGERWLLFLRRSREDGSPQWPGPCGGHLLLEGERFVNSARVEAHLAALRSLGADSTVAPGDPWIFREHAGAACVISKAFRSARGAGQLSLSSVKGRAHFAALFAPTEARSYGRANDESELRIDIGDELHQISNSRDVPRRRAYYQAHDSAAELFLNALRRIEPSHLRVSLGDDFVTEVGVYRLLEALEKLEGCREQEQPPHPGWIEVAALGEWGRRESLRFTWSIAHADRPTEFLATDRRNRDWEALSAGWYVVHAECYGEQQQERVRIAEGKTERLTVRCGTQTIDD